MDPSPFIEKDLDADAEEFILSWAQEFPADDAIQLHIYLEQWPVEDPKEPIKTAVHNYFAHRAEIANLEFKRLMEKSCHWTSVPVRMPRSQQGVIRSRGGHLGSHCAGESYDCRMGSDVAADANLSL
jgi:hypothetical protein